MVFKRTVRTECKNISIAKYLMDYVIEKAKRHESSVSHEIAICILQSYLNDKEK